METWIDRIKTHPIHQGLQTLESALAPALVKGLNIETTSDLLSRLEHVVQYVRGRLIALNPLLASPTSLDNLNNIVNSITQQLTQFASNDNIAHVNNANAEADRLLVAMTAVPVTELPQDIDAVRTAIEKISERSVQYIETIRLKSTDSITELNQLRADTLQLKNNIDSEKIRFDQIIGQYQQQFSQSQEARQNEFNQAEKERSETSRTATDKSMNELSKLKEAKENEFIELIDSSRKSVTVIIKDIGENRDKAKALVGIIAGTGMAGGYQKDANVQRNAFRLWSFATIVGFVGLIGFAIRLFIDAGKVGHFEWWTLAARFAVLFAFGLFSAYTGRIAMKYRENEREQRHKQLAFESVNPFLEDLEPEIQKKIKERMADEYLVKFKIEENRGADVAPTTIDGLFKVIGKLIDKAK